MRKIRFANKEFYHIFNRGNDRKIIFPAHEDLMRFAQGLEEFNTLEPIGSIYANNFKKANPSLRSPAPKSDKIVNIVCYCINLNHYHLILEQRIDRGIEKFMHRLGTGYSNFFNKKYRRTGSLFEGRFKAVHIDSNEYLLHLSAYVNLNNQAHQLKDIACKSSWPEYSDEEHDQKFCAKDIILNQFQTRAEYKQFAEKSLVDILEKKELQQELLLE